MKIHILCSGFLRILGFLFSFWIVTFPKCTDVKYGNTEIRHSTTCEGDLATTEKWIVEMHCCKNLDDGCIGNEDHAECPLSFDRVCQRKDSSRCGPAEEKKNTCCHNPDNQTCPRNKPYPTTDSSALREDQPRYESNHPRMQHMQRTQRMQRELWSAFQTFGELPRRNCCSYLKVWLKRSDCSDAAVHISKLERVNCLLMNELAMQDHVGVEVRWLVTKKHLIPEIEVPWMVRAYGSIEQVDDVDVIVTGHLEDYESMAMVADTSAAAKWRRRSTASVVSMCLIFSDIGMYETQYHLIGRLWSLQQRGIQTLQVEAPLASRVRNQSKWEREGTKIGWNLTNRLSGMSGRYTPEIVSNVKMTVKVVKHKDYQYSANIKSKYVNIINRVRFTPGLPLSVSHTIHMLGDSIALGYPSADEDTVASWLQQIINEKQGKERTAYATVNYGTPGLRTLLVERYLRDVTIREGDIVTIIVSGWWGSRSSRSTQESFAENGVPLFLSQTCFDRPHGMGEVFADNGHLNPKGNKKIAEILYDKLFLNPTRLPVAKTFKHYMCGSVAPVQTDAETLPGQTEDALGVSSEFVLFVQGLEGLRDSVPAVGCIVMNCNPFTRGHQYLVETAASQVDRLYIFVVEEDRSEFPFADRLRLVRAGRTHLPNVEVLPSGKFVISSITLPEYFVKGSNPDADVDASTDVGIFGRWIARALGGRVRFAGEEPFDRVTLQYNRAMQDVLPAYDVGVKVIARREFGGMAISASHVRLLLKNNGFTEIASIVPSVTFAYLGEKFGTLI